MEPKGARLKKIRLEKGLTLEEIQKKTKIHLNILKGIEDDSLAGISPIYIKGFLKIYCKLLGIDPRDYISDYKEPDTVIPAAPSKEGNRKRVISFLPRIKIRTVIIAIIVVISIIGLFKLGKFISAKRYFPLARRSQLSIAIPSKKTKKKSQLATTAPKIAAVGFIRLGMYARDNTYLSLKVDGRLVFQGILRKGISESWQAKEKIEFSLSNAGVVELQINGRAISSLGRRQEAVKGMITKDGGLDILR